MILIADSGSTSTEWVLLEKQEARERLHSKGLNPVVLSAINIKEIIAATFPDTQKNLQIKQLYFFGAGCWNAEYSEKIEQALQDCFVNANIVVQSDIWGAIKATCGKEAGITCILGTGTNTCVFDGNQIVDNIPSLGYILGDEGSGTHLGKQLLQHYFYRELPDSLEQQFVKQYQLNKSQVIERVYRQVGANRYLASFTPFLSTHLTQPFVRNLVKASFDEFLERHVLKYKQSSTYPIHFVGSIAHHFRPVLESCVIQKNLQLGKIIQYPINNLVNYYS